MNGWLAAGLLIGVIFGPGLGSMLRLVARAARTRRREDARRYGSSGYEALDAEPVTGPITRTLPTYRGEPL